MGSLISLIGLGYLLKAIWTVLIAIRVALTPINIEWASKYGLGSWAVITGCTEGIGKAFCFPLADIRFNLCLVSRNRSKLEALQKEIKQKYPSTQTKIIVADFSEYSQKLYDRIMQELSGIDVSMLVNNVGIASISNTTVNIALLKEQNTTEIESQINVNVNAITHLTHRLIKGMLRRQYRCGIINLSSMSIAVPFRQLSVYCGTKAFDDVFSRVLSEEFVNTNIDVVSSRPAIVSTAGTNNSKDPMASSARSCVIGTLKALGRVKSTEGSFFHVVQSWFVSLVGETLARKLGDNKLDEIDKIKSA